MNPLAIFAPLLKPGTPAPAFNMIDHTGRLVRSSDLVGKTPFVLVFYPADFTPGCTTQLCEFKDQYHLLQERGIEVFGVNPFGWETHRKFAEEKQFPFRLLLDPHCKYADQYHATLIPHFINKRVVYGIDQHGLICYAKNGKPPVTEVLAAFQN